jgi:hypothetical protein
MLIPVVVMAVLAIAFVAVPAGAINQATTPGGGTVLNAPPVPLVINYQGYLTDADGNPVNDTLEMTFSIYDTAEGGEPVWTETQPAVTVTEGIFNVLLGSVNPISAGPLTGESYLGVKVGSDEEMTPRQQIAAVAYAHRSGVAGIADTLDLMDSTDFVAVAGDTMTGQLVLPVDGLVAGTDQFVLTGGKVGIGTTAPGDYKLNVQGGSNNGIYASGNVLGVYGYGSTSGSFGILGTPNGGVLGNGSGYGVYGVNNVSGNYGYLGGNDEGVYGEHSTSGNWGQLGTSDGGIRGNSSSGWGVYGTTYSGAAMYGRSNMSGNSGNIGTEYFGVSGRHYTSGNRGILGTSDEGVLGVSSIGIGVSGNNTTSGNYGQLGTSIDGVFGVSNTDTGSGVAGINTSGGNGVYGRNDTSWNYGKLGTTTEGVYGENSNGNYGQLGTSDYGVYGSSSTWGVCGSGDTYGVYGSGGNSGVFGKDNESGSYGRLGYGNTGVYGSGSFYGVYGSSDTFGVSGFNSGSGNTGRLGTADEGVYGSSSSGTGVHGTSISGTGVYGDGGEWDFYAASGESGYGPFTGGHEVKFANSFPQDFRPGLIVSVTGESQLRTEDGEISYSSTLPTVRLADTPSDKTVFGVLISESPLPEEHWYQAGEGERFGIVNALGEGRVWVTSINGDINAGDYITTSAIAGYGQKQDDDLLHSYTLGKATETVDWSQVTETVDFNGKIYKAYPIAVVYTSG